MDSSSKKCGNPWTPALANAGRVVAAAAGPVLACIALAGGIPALAWVAAVAGVLGGLVLWFSPVGGE